jgi:hypothetical protein
MTIHYQRKKAYAFGVFVREFHELHELKAAKQLFYRRQSRLTPQNAAIIRVIREISGQKNNCEAINSLGNLTDIH